MRDAWHLLQIEPTHDVRAIKAAYARLLRTARPDDDAAAYQALREAYDCALGWAKRHPTEHSPALDAPAPHEAAAESDARREPADAPQWEAGRANERLAAPPAEPDTADAPHWQARAPEPPPQPDALRTWFPLPDGAPAERPLAASVPPVLGDSRSIHTTPDELVARAKTTFRSGGYPTLREIWDQLEQGLDRLPLAAGVQASTAFASWVLEEPALPSPLLLRLQERFHWSDDFRATAALPRELAHKLTARIARARAVPDDEALYWTTELLKRLRLGSGWRTAWRLAWLDALAPRDWRAFREPRFAETLAIAGANAREKEALTRAARAGSRLRVSAALACATLLGALLGGGEGLVKRLIMGLSFGGTCLATYLFSRWVVRVLLWLLDGLSHGLPEKLRNYRGSTLLADGCVTILALFGAGLATLPPAAPLARVMTGVLARLPEALAIVAAALWLLAHRSEASLGPPAFGFAAGIWSEPMRAEHQPAAAGYMALIWLGAACMALEGLLLVNRRYGDRLRALDTGIKGYAQAVATLVVLMLALPFLAPALPTALYRKHGPVAGFAPFCVPLALGAYVEKQPGLLAVSLAAASLVMIGAQEQLTRAARRVMR